MGQGGKGPYEGPPAFGAASVADDGEDDHTVARYARRGFALAHLPNVPWSIKYYWTWRGCENLHVYLWSLKDFCWCQAFYYPAEVFGVLALVWSAVLYVRAVYYRCYSEMVIAIAHFLWLVANNVWMYGELSDLHATGDWGHTFEVSSEIAKAVLEADLYMLIAYYMFIRRSEWLADDRKNPMSRGFNDIGFRPRFRAIFKDWREYEHIHIFFWIAKDIGWMLGDKALWTVFVIPTILVAFDFVFNALQYKYSLLECCHMIMYFWWIMGNSLWALVDVYGEEDAADIYTVFERPNTLLNFRWWGGWMFMIAFAVIIALYAVWIPASLMGKCHAHDDEIEVEIDGKRYDGGAMDAEDGSRIDLMMD